MNKNALWITQTAAATALLVVMQAVTAPLGSTLVTGSIVNLILIVTVMVCGLSAGLTVAVLSPIFAKLFGIGPLWELIPFIILGNGVLVVLWHLLGRRKADNPLPMYGLAAVVAAVAKFLTLYVGIVLIAIPLLLHLPEKQAAIVSGVFSFPQLLTALVGGGLAMLAVPLVGKALKR